MPAGGGTEAHRGSKSDCVGLGVANPWFSGLVAQTAETDRRLLPLSDVARMTGLSRSTVKKYVREGTLPAIRLGAEGKRGAIRVDEEVLNAWIDDRDGLSALIRRERLAGLRAGLILSRRDHLRTFVPTKPVVRRRVTKKEAHP